MHLNEWRLKRNLMYMDYTTRTPLRLEYEVYTGSCKIDIINSKRARRVSP